MKQLIITILFCGFACSHLLGQWAITPGAGQGGGDQIVVDWAIGSLIIGDLSLTGNMQKSKDTFSSPSYLPRRATIGKSAHFAEVVLFPNPAIDKVSILLKDFQTSSINIQILSAFGQAVYKQQLDNQDQTIWLDISRFTAGTYIIKVIDEHQQTVIKKLFVP